MAQLVLLLTRMEREQRKDDHPGATRKPRVLIAEDDAETRQLLTMIFTAAGYEVDAAPDGVRLLSQVAELRRCNQAPDVIVSDIHMPRASGLDVLKLLRSRGESVPFVLITALPCPHVQAHAEQLGAAALFGKPLNLRTLRSTVSELVQSMMQEPEQKKEMVQ